ncbi:MAG: PepSY domain-containing protein [Rhizobiaceae bacterium]
MARPLLFCTALFVFATTDVNAQDDRKVPPEDSLKLSEIIAKVEARPDFKYVDEIDWDDDSYSVVYFTADKAKVEISYNPVTGEPK